MKFSTRVRYGSRAMVDLAARQEEGPVPLEVLARQQRIPERYLAKIIQDLRRGGLIRSLRGARGGYALSRPADQISLLDVWEALEGPLVPVDCLAGSSGCRMFQECVTREVWQRAGDALAQVLRGETLSKLVRRREEKKRAFARSQLSPRGRLQ